MSVLGQSTGHGSLRSRVARWFVWCSLATLDGICLDNRIVHNEPDSRNSLVAMIEVCTCDKFVVVGKEVPFLNRALRRPFTSGLPATTTTIMPYL